MHVPCAGTCDAGHVEGGPAKHHSLHCHQQGQACGHLKHNAVNNSYVQSNEPRPCVCSAFTPQVCASGLKAVMLADNSIRLGLNDIVVAGGMESMSNVPHYVAGSRRLRMGHSELVDGLIKDGMVQGSSSCARWHPFGVNHCPNAPYVTNLQGCGTLTATFTWVAAQSCVQPSMA